MKFSMTNKQYIKRLDSLILTKIEFNQQKDNTVSSTEGLLLNDTILTTHTTSSETSPATHNWRSKWRCYSDKADLSKSYC